MQASQNRPRCSAACWLAQLVCLHEFACLVAGFLIGPGLLLTNRHVLPTKEVAAASMVEFGYEKDERGVAKPLTQVIKSSCSDLHCHLETVRSPCTMTLQHCKCIDVDLPEFKSVECMIRKGKFAVYHL